VGVEDSRYVLEKNADIASSWGPSSDADIGSDWAPGWAPDLGSARAAPRLSERLYEALLVGLDAAEDGCRESTICLGEHDAE
jgi:hypothetical protein